MLAFAKRLKHERGTTMLLTAAIVVPLLFFLFSLSLDSTRYMVENQKSQKTLDEIALAAYRFLPFEAEAKAAAQSYLSHYPALAAGTQVSVDADAISLMYAGMSPLTFPRFFGFTAGLPISAVSRVRGTPLDSFIVLDVSDYVAPSLFSSAAWGDPIDWPAASFFERDFHLTFDGQAIDPRMATQQCFNPAFSTMKQAAINAFEYLSHFRMNAVGLGVYPGSSGYVDVMRDLVSAHVHEIGPGESHFPAYSGLHNRNALCAAAAELEQIHNAYSFGTPNPRLTAGISPAVSEPEHLTRPDVSQGSWEINPEFIPYVRARHALWSQTRREGAIGNTTEAIRELRVQLVGAAARELRAGLANSVLKSAFIFAGDVPRSAAARFPDSGVKNDLIEQFDALKDDIAASQRSLSLKLYYVLFRFEGNEFDGFLDRVRDLSVFFDEQQKINGRESENLQIRLIFADSPLAFENFGLGPLLLSGRTAVLSR